jgi:hypothetical protein
MTAMWFDCGLISVRRDGLRALLLDGACNDSFVRIDCELKATVLMAAVQP